MKKTDSKNKYSCVKCNVVDKQILARERVDQKAQMYCRNGHGQDEMHGWKYFRVCKHCDHVILLKYESDCTLGNCRNGSKYGGGEHYDCPICRNRFSYDGCTTDEDLSKVTE